MYDPRSVKGSELLRKLHKLGRQQGIPVQFIADRGKGSHGRIYFGSMYTAAKDLKKEIGPGLLRKMCKDLGVDPREL